MSCMAATTTRAPEKQKPTRFSPPLGLRSTMPSWWVGGWGRPSVKGCPEGARRVVQAVASPLPARIVLRRAQQRLFGVFSPPGDAGLSWSGGEGREGVHRPGGAAPRRSRPINFSRSTTRQPPTRRTREEDRQTDSESHTLPGSRRGSGAGTGVSGAEGAEGTASGVPREAFGPGDLASPQISAPLVHPPQELPPFVLGLRVLFQFCLGEGVRGLGGAAPDSPSPPPAQRP